MVLLVILAALLMPLALGLWLWVRRPKSLYNVPRTPTPKKQIPSPYTMREGEVALSFRVGNRYYDSTKNRVFECVALKGKNARLVAFSMLDCVDWVKQEIAKYGDWEFNKVRVVGGVEICKHGRLRADRQATEKEVAGELEFLKRLHTQ